MLSILYAGKRPETIETLKVEIKLLEHFFKDCLVFKSIYSFLIYSHVGRKFNLELMS